MRDSLLLLRLTADLHAATHDAARWPLVWAAWCDWFECPDVYGAAIPPSTNDENWPQRLTHCAEIAGHCARSANGHCGHGRTADEGKRLACLATVEHLKQAAASPTPAFSPSLAALDPLPVPMLLCRADRRLVFANRAAWRELQQSRWLTVLDERLIARDRKLEHALAAEFERLANAGEPAEGWIAGPPLERESANFALRRISGQGTDALIMLTLAVHAVAPPTEHLDRLGERHSLPPRQRELAGHLLAGLSLDEAADRMGITRRTARDHLKGLFRATGTSRQGQLIVHLGRDTAA